DRRDRARGQIGAVRGVFIVSFLIHPFPTKVPASSDAASLRLPRPLASSPARGNRDEHHRRQSRAAQATARVAPAYGLRTRVVDDTSGLARREAEPRDELGKALLERLLLEELGEADLAARLQRLAQACAQPLLVDVELLEQRVGGHVGLAFVEPLLLD